jgi:K+ transporter
MDSFIPMQADDPTYSSAIRGGWHLLKNQFKTLWSALLIFILLLGIGFAINSILNFSAPTYVQLWRFPLFLWITLLDMGLFYLLAKSLTAQPWHIGNLFWAFKCGEAWVLALIYAAIGSVLEAYSGMPIVQPGQKLPADWFMHQQIWIMFIPLILLGVFFVYVFMLYSAYGLNAKMSITSSLGIVGKKWKWLFFPFILTAILILVFIGVGIVLGIFFAILFFLIKYLGFMLVGKIVLALLGVILLIAIYIAMGIWVNGSLLIATGTLMDTKSMHDKLVP